jgi:thiol-disulfide isomerase/thioredoxin
MRKLFSLLVIVMLCVCSCLTTAQEIRAYSADDVIHRTSGKDTVFIINFWATWCAPCVAELPEFNALQQHIEGMPVKILLVSLDFKEDYPYKLAGFVKRKKLLPEVAWLSDTDPNIFIPKIDNSWQGSIPATVIVNTGKQFKQFIEGSITEKQIRRIVDKVLSN